MSHRVGFTLIELSIVLVIIGLITGGVLVGRDLIEAAKIRQQVTQVERFKTAVQTFRTKYNGLPGDLGQTDASAFGFQPRGGGLGHGDGDGMIEYCDSAASALPNLGCENVLFWRDLSDANLIEGSFTTATDAPVTVAAGQANNLFVPDAKVGAQTSVVVFSLPAPVLVDSGMCCNPGELTGLISCGVGSVCYAILNLYNVTNGAYDPEPPAFYGGINGTGLTPLEAFAIDSKIDDGLPLTGNVYGGIITGMPLGSPTGPYPITAGFFPSNCLTVTASPSSPDQPYIVYATSNANVPGCMLNISGQ